MLEDHMKKRNFDYSIIILLLVTFSACQQRIPRNNKIIEMEANLAKTSESVLLSLTKIAEPNLSTTDTPSLLVTVTTPISVISMISEIDGMKMVYVPSGQFLMGSNPPFPDEEQPQHMVYLDAYWIDQTEVTNAVYLLCIRAGACQAPNVIGLDLEETARLNHPVWFVSWENAVRYCNWAGRRLPTEAEWEKAARGTDGRLYPWGNNNANPKLANFGSLGNPTKSVGSYPEGMSPFGALDLAGNVSEWVDDWYGKYKPDEKSDNPKGPSAGNYHLTRGGSSITEEYKLRTAFRSSTIFSDGSSSIGFRCALSEVILK
jgi:formylglycine-generating enzyme required for sulfatase activity